MSISFFYIPVRIFAFDAAKEPIIIRSGYRHARREKEASYFLL